MVHAALGRFGGRSKVGMGLTLAVLAGTTCTSTAHAIVRTWATATSGVASTPVRWSPVGVPAAGDDLVFDVGPLVQSAFTVTFDGTTPTSRSMYFDDDHVTLSMSAAHTTTTGVTIGDSANATAEVTLQGAWTSSAASVNLFNIGFGGACTGILNVSGGSSDLVLSGTSGRMVVGRFGSGTLNVTSQGSVNVGDVLRVGNNTGSSGSLLINGASSSPPFLRSRVDVLGGTAGAAIPSAIGGNGVANAVVSSGGLLDIAENLVIGEFDTGIGQLTVGGASGIFRATCDVAGDMYIGANTDNTLVGGAGTVIVTNGGDVLVGGTLEIGDDGGPSPKELSIQNGGLVQAQTVRDGGGGILNHNGGTLRINGGAYIGHPVPLVVSGTGSPILHFTNNMSKTLNFAVPISLVVGDDPGAGTFTGELLIDQSSELDAGSGDIEIGQDATSSGEIRVDGVGSKLIANQATCLVVVGRSGAGMLDFNNQAEGDFHDLVVQGTVGGAGTVTIRGGSTLRTGSFDVGQSVGTSNGVVSVQTGSQLHVSGTGSSRVLDTGRVEVLVGGVVTAAGTVRIEAGGQWDHAGTITAPIVDIQGGLFRAAALGTGGVVNAQTLVASGGEVEAIDNNLTIGNPALPTGVDGSPGSVLRVGAGRTLTLRSAGGFPLQGRIEMQGGTLVSATGVTLGSANPIDTLVGEGTIDVGIVTPNIGVTTPSGAGLVFLKSIQLNGSWDVSGTSVRFGPACVMTDIGSTHTLACKVTADAGSIMRPSSGLNTNTFGPITMGDSSITGVTLNGELHLGTNGVVTLLDANGVGLGSLTTMNNGIITSLNGVSVSNTRVLRGRGSIDVSNPGGNGLTITSGGTIDPDALNTTNNSYAGVASFTVNGRYTQQATGTYLCEIAGFNNEFQPLNDRIACGQAVLNGILNVSLIDGYVPQLCDEFTILNYTSRTGQWSSIVAPPGVDVGVRYEPTRAVLFFNTVGCDTIDFNNDGLLPDSADLDDLLIVISGGTCSTGQCNDIDFNNDCLLPDSLDIDAFISRIAGGPCLQ